MKVAIIICSVLFGASTISAGIALLYLFVLTTTLFINPLLLLLIAAPLAVLSLIALGITLAYGYRDSANQEKTTSPKTKDQTVEAKPPIQTNQVAKPTPSPLANQASDPKSAPSPEQKKLALTNLKNFFEADFSTQNVENFRKILSELDADEKISAIKNITSKEKRDLFIHCMKNGSSLDTLFASLPKEISTAQKDEIKNAVWTIIDSNNEFFKKIMINTEMETKRESDFHSGQITYNPNFLHVLIKIFPEHDTDIIQKIFQNDASFYQNIIDYLSHESHDFIWQPSFLKHRSFFTAIILLQGLKPALKPSEDPNITTQRKESINYFIHLCKTVHFTQRPFLKKIIDNFFPNTTDERIKALSEQLAKHDVFQNFLESGSLEKFDSNDIYYINNYFPFEKGQKIFYLHSGMEEKILEKIISDEKFFTHLIRNMTDALHILRQISKEQKIRFIKSMINAQSGQYFISLTQNVADLNNLLNSLEYATEAENAVKTMVDNNLHFSHENFFTGQNCRLKNFSSVYILNFIYTKTISNFSLFAKFFDDFADLNKMLNNFDRQQKFSAVKILLSTEQSQHFKNCIQNGAQLEKFHHKLNLPTEEQTAIINLLWIIIDLDFSFFKKIIVYGGNHYVDVHKKYNNTYTCPKTDSLRELLEIFPNHKNEIFEKVFSCDFSVYQDVLTTYGFFGDRNSFLTNSFFADHQNFIKGVVALTALQYHIETQAEYEVKDAMTSLEIIAQQITPTEQPLFLKVLNDIFPETTEEKTQIFHWVKEPSNDNSSKSIPSPTPIVYKQPETNNSESEKKSTSETPKPSS